jgi:uncharacterized protein (DUF1800 family)
MTSSANTIDPEWAWQAFSPTADQPWDRAAAAHLFRRAAFGASAAQLDAALEKSPDAVVEELLEGATESSDFRRDRDSLAAAVLSTGEPQQLAAWWAYVMLHTPHPLLERMTLFWHGHFAVSAAKVTDAELMFQQNALLRRRALNDFRALVHDVSRDPAMLIYLDSATNRKGRPNENFARELMELFCLGEGQYSEQDVQQLARCFTGWEIKQQKFRFNRFQHDSGEKSLLGKAGTFPDGEAIDWILDQLRAAEFIVGKLYSALVCDEPAPDQQLLAPLADEFRTSGMNTGAVVRRILTSRLFFSDHARARKVRSPVDLAVGLLRTLEGTANTHQLSSDLQANGQGLFFPPNVKGWDGGRTWINSATILGRANMTTRLLADGSMRFGGGALDEYFSRLGAAEPEQIIDRVAELLVAVPLSPKRRARLIEVCGKNSNRSRGIAEAIRTLAALPEFQLC